MSEIAIFRQLRACRWVTQRIFRLPLVELPLME
jgi:hypothetical protein